MVRMRRFAGDGSRAILDSRFAAYYDVNRKIFPATKETPVDRKNYSLGLDSSTQSITAVVLDLDSGRIVHQQSLDYATDSRLNGYGIHHADYIVPPREPGEADQPPLMFLASLDALFQDMKTEGIEMSAIRVINDSGQQHGHVYLGSEAADLFSRLDSVEAAKKNLPELLDGSFSYGTAPIWKTSNTGKQAEDIRSGVGGKAQVIKLSGSDSPLRFSGAVIRRVGEQFPELYAATDTIQLISSFIPAVLSGNHRVPIDFANGCGTSLMDYAARAWSDDLIGAAAKNIPGGAEGMKGKLPALAAPDTVVGTIARYFVEKYGFDSSCRVTAGSGDNPQTKVLVSGDLLSLGTSFVNMVSTDGSAFDMGGYANGMYDGIGRPFMFGCRTNGAMVWSGVRTMHNLGRDEYAPADGSLSKTPVGGHIFLWQPDNESFPVSGTLPPARIGYDAPDLALDYSGVIESSLSIVYLYSRGFAGSSATPIAVTGGVTKVPEILRRVAGIWNRPVTTIGTVGAALGAAVAGAGALTKAGDGSYDVEALNEAVLPRGDVVEPRPEDVQVFHGDGGYLRRLQTEYEKRI